MRLHSLVFIAALALVIGSVSANAQDVLYGFQIQGSKSPVNGSLGMTMSINAGAVKAITVYSEPSHTAIAAFVDSAEDLTQFPSLPKGTPRMGAMLKVGMKGTLQGRAPLTGDNALLIETHVEAGATVVPQRFKVNTSLDRFGFWLERLPPPATASGGKKLTVEPNVNEGPYRFTCLNGDGGSCGTSMVTCSVNEASCCKTDEPSCGWCGKTQA